MEYLIVIAFCFALYFKSIFFGHVVDDTNALTQARHYKHVKNFPAVLYGAGLFENTLYDHILRVVLTCAIGCMLLCNFGIWVALLWCCHPINNQTTLWLNGRRYQISILLSLLCYKFPLTGFVVYPLAIYFHPIAIPMIIVTAVTVTPIALLWAFPAMLCYDRLSKWLQARWGIQSFDIYKKFNWHKPIMAVKCLAEYFRHGLFPQGFTMYHPDIWGVAELAGNRARCYGLNAFFWLSIAFVSVCAWLAWVSGEQGRIGLLIAIVGVIQWLGIWINPTQLWAQRYASISSIGFSMILIAYCDCFPMPYAALFKMFIIALFSLITFKDMEMYRDFFSFFWHHAINQPFNMNAGYFGTMGMNSYADTAKEQKKGVDALLYHSTSTAMGLLWCFRNRKQDIIHTLMMKKMKGQKNV